MFYAWIRHSVWVTGQQFKYPGLQLAGLLLFSTRAGYTITWIRHPCAGVETCFQPRQFLISSLSSSRVQSVPATRLDHDLRNHKLPLQTGMVKGSEAANVTRDQTISSTSTLGFLMQAHLGFSPIYPKAQRRNHNFALFLHWGLAWSGLAQKTFMFSAQILL